jgi:23S rRNA (uracil1939-C5)-methyltransferase
MNSLVTLKIESIAYGGNGVGRHNGIVYFVPGVLPGETVLVSPIRKKKKYVFAYPEEILIPSPTRIAPKCPYTLNISSKQQTYCPGCQYQHMDYKEELLIKNKQFGDLLRRIAKLNPDIRETPAASPEHYAYRNKITLHSEGQNNKHKFGYYTVDNNTLIEIRNCPLACRQINTLLGRIYLDNSQNIPSPSTLTLRYTENDGAKYQLRSRKNNPDIQQQANSKAIYSKKSLLQEDTSFGKFYVPQNSFFQINFYLRDKLIKKTLNILKENPMEYVFDLFCGVGVFGICAAKTSSSLVYGSDIDRDAVNTAKINATVHQINNIKFFAMPAQDAANKIFGKISAEKTTLILDPPRTGLNKKLIQDISTKHRPKNILYISCSADTLCRDINILSEAGYSARSTQLFDMFPRTAHFETITFLLR